ncbi:MAG: hypothetical protein N3F10_00760 [Candidatus Bathyarchaeota archaeon]|nr:hypothetical protein [Candidatus Bathyarchaeota archaeon]MCX8176823.1 hypothetical protein [Candidatus Bathyarchaeota archaeon]MDW8194584.1 hypothetical protein [Nitrososphaerota archaeon]
MKVGKIQFTVENDRRVLEELAVTLYRKYRIKCFSVEPLHDGLCLVTVFSASKKIEKIAETVK